MSMHKSAHSLSPAHPVHLLAQRNLQLLSAIESTLEVLHADTTLVNAVELAYKEMHGNLQGVEYPIDTSGHLDCVLSKSSDLCSQVWHTLKELRQAAIDDTHLVADSGVIQAYEHYLSALCSLHDTIEALRHWVGDHDAVLETATSPVFENVDSLFDHITKTETPAHA